MSQDKKHPVALVAGGLVALGLTVVAVGLGSTTTQAHASPQQAPTPAPIPEPPPPPPPFEASAPTFDAAPYDAGYTYDGGH